MEFRNEYTYELIEDYLCGNLSPEKKEEVEKLMATQPGFAEEVEWMKLMLDRPQRQREMQALEGFRQYRASSPKQTSGGGIIRNLLSGSGGNSQHISAGGGINQRFQWMRAIAASLLMGVMLWGISKRAFQEDGAGGSTTQAPPTNQNYPVTPPTDGLPDNPQAPPASSSPSPGSSNKPAENASPPTIAATETRKKDWAQFAPLKGELQTLGDGEHPMLDSALVRLDKGKTKEALPYLEKYLASLPAGEDDIEYRIETGKIYLRQKNGLGKAAAHFQTALDHAVMDSDKAAARFHLALAQLIQGKNAEAKVNLEEVAKMGLPKWSDEAKGVLKEIENR